MSDGLLDLTTLEVSDSSGTVVLSGNLSPYDSVADFSDTGSSSWSSGWAGLLGPLFSRSNVSCQRVGAASISSVSRYSDRRIARTQARNAQLVVRAYVFAP